MPNLKEDGHEIHRGVFGPEEISAFREEVDRVSREARSTSVRHLTEHSEMFRELSRSEKLAALVGETRFPVRSVLFDKTPEGNWPVLWHQDLTIAVEGREEVEGYENWSVKEEVTHVQPPSSLLSSMVTARVHLDCTKRDNGALKVCSGSHRRGRILQADIADLVGEKGETVCECEAGDVLLMSPLILHSSPRSENPSRRRVLHFEFAEPGVLDPRLRWYETASYPNSPRIPTMIR